MSGSILRNGALTALMIVGFGGCAKAANPPQQPRPAAYEPVVVDVRNNNWNTVVVYAYAHGQATRMGEVTTGSTAELTTPVGMDPATTDFELIVDPIGARQTYRTGRLLVNPGDRVVLQIQNDLNLSSATTRASTD
jgi:hypothetical protein